MMARKITDPTMLSLMTQTADARLAKLEERVEGQGRTLTRIDGTMERIAGVLERISTQAHKIEHISDSVDDVKRSIADHGSRIIVAERDLSLLQQQVSLLEKDINSLHEISRKTVSSIETHRPVIRVAMWVSGLIGASAIGLGWMLLTGQMTLVLAG